MSMSFGMDLAAYHRKLRDEWNDFRDNQDSPSKATTAFTTAYHLIEWYWAAKVKKDATLRSHLGVHSKDEFGDYCRRYCPELEIAQDIANGTKRFATNSRAVQNTTKAGGWDETPWDVAPWDETSLLLKLKVGHWVLARDVLLKLVAFWNNFDHDHLAP